MSQTYSNLEYDSKIVFHWREVQMVYQVFIKPVECVEKWGPR